MGRRERPLDPDGTPLAQFAIDLRRLRRRAGPIGYRELAARAHYSATTLSQAAGGEVLPTLDVVLAYVKACGGEEGEWRQRWRSVAALVDEGRTADARPAPDPEPTTAPVAPVGRLRRARRVAYGATGAVVVMLAVVMATADNARLTTVRPPAQASTAPDLDGHDPKDTHCADDAVALDRAPLQLTTTVAFGSRQVPAGTVIGSVELRYSPRCRAAWGKLTPSGLVDYPAFGSVVIEAVRPATGTTLQFVPGHLEQVYGDMLLTGLGCVFAEGTITASSGPAITAVTGCWTAPSKP